MRREIGYVGSRRSRQPGLVVSILSSSSLDKRILLRFARCRFPPTSRRRELTFGTHAEEQQVKKPGKIEKDRNEILNKA